jgi:acetyl esterase
MRCRLFFRCALLVVVLTVLPMFAMAQQSTTSISGAVSHVYKSIGGTELRLYAFSPADRSQPWPAILLFFGGRWTSGNVEQVVPPARYLAERGMVAIVVDYRVFDRHGTTPFEAMADAKSAIRWVRSHAKELEVDPTRIVASGGSSGGHIALSAAVFDRFDERSENVSISSKPNALVLFYPIVDTSKAPTFAARAPGRELEGSPSHHLVRPLPPTLVLHGKADPIPYETIEGFCVKARALRSRCDLVGFEGAEHEFFNPAIAGGKWYREALLEMDRFLTAIGFLSKDAAGR